MRLPLAKGFVIAASLLSCCALAQRPEFSTTAAKSDYDFAKNPPAKVSFSLKRTSRHDFSKTTAAHADYDFADNKRCIDCEGASMSTPHDLSKTEAAK
ncbi:hypothetical protein [Shewanella algidipiscicola]|uniref:Uncharacterized protein n=1 Tax=Shewanella algidipiscicola TaxID=614070 RepID=A0ABQ4PEG3_9GAMM|nr:hypothetical protein [Shewanella algidipiscicola]GIU45942.1 hypothetical protein TUM4630_15250 [Shewanella algidipiscicola]